MLLLVESVMLVHSWVGIHLMHIHVMVCLVKFHAIVIGLVIFGLFSGVFRVRVIAVAAVLVIGTSWVEWG